jgi:hypothetical protein
MPTSALVDAAILLSLSRWKDRHLLTRITAEASVASSKGCEEIQGSGSTRLLQTPANKIGRLGREEPGQRAFSRVANGERWRMQLQLATVRGRRLDGNGVDDAT